MRCPNLMVSEATPEEFVRMLLWDDEAPMARDPLDRITELCQLHPEGVLTKIAEVLGCGDADIANMLHAARNSAFEAAAQVCDAERERLLGVGGTGFDTASNLGRRIRKLKVDAPGVTGAPDQTFSHQTPMERP